MLRTQRTERQGWWVGLIWGKWEQRTAMAVLMLGLGCCETMAVRAVERADAGRTELAQAATAGQIEPFTVTGQLDQSSERLQDDGSYFNMHRFEGFAGQSVVIDLVSEEFDTYLILVDPNGGRIVENVDSDGRNAQIVIQLPSTGTYTILANALEAEATGSYTLSMKAATSDDLALAEATRLRRQVFELLDQKQYAEAIPLAQQSLEIRERILGANHPLFAASLHNLASIYTHQWRYSEAEPLYQRALLINEQHLGANHLSVAANLNNLAALYGSQSRFSEAEPLYQRALLINEQHLGANHPQVALSLNELGELYRIQGRYSEAEPLYQRALSIREQQRESNYLDIATSLNSLALLYRTQGRYSEAEPLYQRALLIREQHLGANHLQVALSLNNLGELYTNQRRYGEAEPLFQRALSIHEQQRESNYSLTSLALSLNNLGELYRGQGRYSEAEPLLQRALLINEQQREANHPQVALNLNNLAVLYFSGGNISRGLELMNRASAIEETNLALILAVGSEARKQAYVATLSSRTSGALSVHLQSAPNSPEAARLALTIALRRKGRVLDAVSDNLRQLRQNLRPAEQLLFDELNDIRAQLGTLLFTGAEIKSPETYKTQVASLQAKAEELENTLAQRSSEFRVKSQPVTIEAIQTLIPTDAALVELVQYRPFNLKAAKESEKWSTSRYAAYVLHPNGEIKWVELGEAEPIDQLVEKFRESLRFKSPDIQTVGRELDAKLMQPIRPLLGNSNHVLLSPDSQLNLIPFAALIDEQNRYLVENYTFTYLTSGRDLLKLQLDSPSRQSPVLLANPDYDQPGSSEVAQIASTSPSPATPSNRGSETQRSLDLTSLKFDPLGGTQQEADAIAFLLPNFTVLTKSQATENVLKELQAPSILHIATHGFFLQDIECVPIPDARGSTATIDVINTGQPACRPTPRNTENPLLRSGLALAGFNPRQSGREEGVLTALEASGLNLYGTKLVVMSACETGLGDVANGEGVYGLRRAFVMAGSESQLMSLWKVDDYGTSELMSLYYQRLKNGEGRSEALRQVQQEMRAAPAYAHPYYWAGFIFSGDWSPMTF